MFIPFDKEPPNITKVKGSYAYRVRAIDEPIESGKVTVTEATSTSFTKWGPPNIQEIGRIEIIAAAASILKSLRTALEMYMTDKNMYPNTKNEAIFESVMAPYISFQPTSTGGSNSYWQRYAVVHLGRTLSGFLSVPGQRYNGVRPAIEYAKRDYNH